MMRRKQPPRRRSLQGFGIAIAYMAAKAGKFEEADVPALTEAAKATGKFSEQDFAMTK